MPKIGSKPNLRQGSQYLRRSPRILTESQYPGGFAMTMPDERTRALVWAGGFLVELARDDSLPLSIRRRAVVIARHFPTIEDISAMAQSRQPSGMSMSMASPDETSSWAEDCRHGPLRHSTHLAWPRDLDSQPTPQSEPPMSNSKLRELVDAHERAETAAQTSSLAVWRAVVEAEPDLAAEILQLFSTVEKAADWATKSHRGLDASPARLIAQGRADAVAEIVRKAAHGFVF